jgi:DNA gyrase subunit B
MTRDYGAEIDQLRAEVGALKQRLAASQRKPERTGRQGIDPDFPQAVNTVSYSGYYDNGVSEGSQWQVANEEIAAMLDMDDSRTTRILSALGSKERFAILKLILQQPMTAGELVVALNLGTTGKAYHHLNALQAADFVTNVNGRFCFQGHRVQGFIMILAGIGDLVDETFGKGNMDEL